MNISDYTYCFSYSFKKYMLRHYVVNILSTERFLFVYDFRTFCKMKAEKNAYDEKGIEALQI